MYFNTIANVIAQRTGCEVSAVKPESTFVELGSDMDTAWNNLVSGYNGIGPITYFDTTNYKAKLAAQVKGFDPMQYMDRSETLRSDKFAQYAMGAAVQAVEESGVIGTLPSERVAVYFGSGIGGLSTVSAEIGKLENRGPHRVSPLCVPMMIANMAAGMIAIRFGCKGAALPAVTACASGSNAIGEALRVIRHGYADAVITGGAEASAEFTYYDLTLRKERRIRAICSEKTPGSGPRYVMLYNVEKAPQEACRVQIRTFGWFDVFVEDKPIAFRNEKARELLALLVDRRGGYVSAEEAIGFLWEEESANSVTLSRYRKVALRLKNTLEEYGIGDIVESVNGKRRLATEKVRCDLYDYLSGEEKHAQLFKGSYLTNYSWGETTLAELLGEHLLGEE